jgi:hypothetical protein
MVEGPAMSENTNGASLKLGDLVKIRGSGFKRARIVELRGGLGPGGQQVYRVRVRSKPTPMDVEVLEEQLVSLTEQAQQDKLSRPAYVFLEGEVDETFLRRVLPAELANQTELVKTGDSESLPSLVRSCLARRRAPLAVLVDADSLKPAAVEARRESIEESIQAADDSVPVKVVVVIPEIEVWFFTVPEAIERVLGEKVSADLVTLGQRDPKGVLAFLSGRSKAAWDSRQAIAALDDKEIDRIRARPDVVELTRFLQDVLAGDKAG